MVEGVLAMGSSLQGKGIAAATPLGCAWTRVVAIKDDPIRGTGHAA